MAKFCQHCGAALTEGIKFCPSCGTPVAQSAQPTRQQQSQQPQQQPKQYTPKPQVKIPEQFAQRNAAPVKKKKGKGGSAATNLVNSLFSKGVDNVIGFTITVLIDETNFWTSAFMSNIANGQSIATAINNADYSIQNDPILGGRTSYTISNRLIRGSTATVPCP